MYEALTSERGPRHIRRMFLLGNGRADARSSMAAPAGRSASAKGRPRGFDATRLGIVVETPRLDVRGKLALALLHDPEVLILDEPTSGLDPNQVHEVRQLIRDLGKTKTVLLSTHILQEVKAVCSRVILIDEGRIVFDGSVDSMEGQQHDMESRFRELTKAAG